MAAPLLVAIHAGIGPVVLKMALDAVVHLHAALGAPGRITQGPAPYVARVSADPIFLIRTQGISRAMLTVAALASEFAELDVRDVGKIDVLRLAGIDLPHRLAVGSYILLDEPFLRHRRSHGGGVTSTALL